MIATDLKLTRAIYNASPKNKEGDFLPPLGVLRKYNLVDPLNPTDAELDRVFQVYLFSGFDDIDAFNPDRPLPRIQALDLNQNLIAVLLDATILQINDAIHNQLTETKDTSQNSTGSFTSSVTPNTRIVSPDQLSQDVEDELGKIQYTSWRVLQQEDGSYTVIIGDADLAQAKTLNGIALSALTFEQLTPADLTFLGKQAMIQLIDTQVAKARAFRGTWDAADVNELQNIDAIWAGNGLDLTDGQTTLTPANTVRGDTILVTVTSENDFAPEEVVFDGAKWVPITNNNTEKADITDIKARLTAIESDYVKSTDLPDFTTFELKTDAQAARAQLQNQIDTERRRNDTQQDEIDLNTAGRIEWEDERADYVRVGDVAGAVSIPLNNLPAVEVGDTVEIDLTVANFAAIKNGVIASVKLVPKPGKTETDSIFIRDSFGDASSVPNTILGDTDASVTITADKAVIANLGVVNRGIIVNDYQAILLEQLPANVAGLDATARTLAQAATNRANQAIADAAKGVKKQLIENADFNTFAEFKALLQDDDLIAVSFAAGPKVTGRVTDTGNANPNDPVVISGTDVALNVFKVGAFSIDENFTITGGTKPRLETDVKYEVGDLPEGKFGTARYTKLKKLVDAGKAVVFLKDGQTIAGTSGTADGETNGRVPALTSPYLDTIQLTKRVNTTSGGNTDVDRSAAPLSLVNGGTSETQTSKFDAYEREGLKINGTKQSIPNTSGSQNKAYARYIYKVEITKAISYAEYAAL